MTFPRDDSGLFSGSSSGNLKGDFWRWETSKANCINSERPRVYGAGDGNRTIHAYSFYVTYCKHTNARTAQPAVCPPPMYKIMYKKFEGRLSRRFCMGV
jgi:hypothetical protein